jgi:hypothetical protein
MNAADETGSGTSPMYQVTAEREGKRWHVRIEAAGGRAYDLETPSLDDVETAVWDLVTGAVPDPPGGFLVEVRLPPAIGGRLELVERLRAQAARELQSAVDEMDQAGFAPRDVDYLIGEQGRVVLGRQRAAVTNAEIARQGLVDHPDAVAVSWDDHGHFATLTCRSCVESNTREYAELPPEDENALVYDENDLYCDRCGKDIVATRRGWVVH